MKNLLTLVLVFFSLHNLFSQNVSEEIAKKVATNWYLNYCPSKNLGAKILITKEYKQLQSTCFYIFAFDRGGFVMVSANNQTEPILGYSFEGTVSDTINYPALKDWFDGYARPIEILNTTPFKSATVNLKWQQILENQFLESKGLAVGPLLTTTWDQSWPYNVLCPNVPAGCVSVAVAQILKYHNYPSRGLGRHGYTCGSYPYTEANFGETAYQWSNMPNKISEVNNDVATLIYQCAVAANVAWSPSGSGSSLYCASMGFINYFKMAFSSMKEVNKSQFTNEEWDSILRNELTNNRPILYAGYNENKSIAHVFICDGVDASNLYHFNFGWGGANDGYYLINDILGGSLSYDQGALIGIQPNNGSTIISNTIWADKQTINTPIAIPDGITLAIQSGANIKFNQGSWLQVYGSINAFGKVNDSIIITASDTLSGWQGIKINHNFENIYENTAFKDNDTCRFDYCNISYANDNSLNLKWIDKIIIKNSQFNNNNATNEGGAIASTYTNLNIYNSTFNNNKAQSGGGAISAQGKIIRIFNSNFHNNISSSSGGAIFLQEVDNMTTIQENLITGNTAFMGGGIAITHCSPSILNNLICNNKARVGGGAFIFMEHSGGIITNNLIANNTSNIERSEYGGGALIAYTYSSPTFINNTIVNNFSNNDGGCAYLWDNSNPIFKNCIIYGNDSRFNSDKPFYTLTSDSRPSFYYCDLQEAMSNLSDFIHNSITTDPVFVTPSSGTGINYDGVTANWQLQATSFCINAGTPDTTGLKLPFIDIAGNQRVLQNRVDIGAYEYLCLVPLQLSGIIGQTTVCPGQKSVNYSVPTIANATSYVWTLPSGATGTSTTNSITVEYGTYATSGNVTVKGNNSCGDGAASTLAITVNAIPPKPTISLTSNVLHSDASNGNQWYTQNGFLNGAINQDYTVSVNGDYYVIVTLLGCSSDASNILNVILTGIEVTENKKTVKVYPNPVSNELFIEMEGSNGKLNFEIVNTLGQIVLKGNLVDKTIVQTSNFLPGIYLIKLENGKTFEFKKIIKE
jgi:predicted outer membrane repeat protein